MSNRKTNQEGEIMDATIFILTSLALIWCITLCLGGFNDLIERGKARKKVFSKEDNEDINGFDLSREEFYRTLNYMLMMNIIDYQQYNELEVKALPYIQ
jgi:hypothetical protein